MEYKVEADIGDGEGGGFYDLAKFNSIALAFIFMNILKPFFGLEMTVVNDMLGIPSEYDGTKFKGVRLIKDKKEIERLY